MDEIKRQQALAQQDNARMAEEQKQQEQRMYDDDQICYKTAYDFTQGT